MRFECELQGNFDEILASIDRSIMIEAEEASDSCTENVRRVVRKYSSGVEFVLAQTTDNIGIVVDSKEDSVFGSGIYFDLIKDAVEEYRKDNARKDYSVSTDNTDKVYIQTEDTVAEKSKSYTYTKNDITENNDDELSEIGEVKGTPSKSTAYTKSSECCSDTAAKERKSEKSLEKAFKFTCKCDGDKEVEFFKSTFEHIGEDLWQSLADSSKKDYYVMSTNWWRGNGFSSGIAKILESIIKFENYDYYTMIRGLFCILAGLVVVLVGAVFKFDYNSIEYMFFYILLQAFRLYMLYQIFRGIMYVLPFVQKWYRIFEWSCTKRFVFKTKLIPVGGSYMPDGSRGVTKTNEVVLYEDYLEFYYDTGMKKVYYSDCVSVFETENFFVIMVQNNYIVSIQKNDMTKEQQDWVRESLSPYYKKECEYSVFI